MMQEAPSESIFRAVESEKPFLHQLFGPSALIIPVYIPSCRAFGPHKPLAGFFFTHSLAT